MCFLTSACSLTGEARFWRPLPQSSDVIAADGAQPDGGDPDAIDLDAAADGAIDGAQPDGAVDVPTVDAGPTCVPNASAELCNGIDDDCNGAIDDVTAPAGTPVPCIAGNRPGHLMGCTCVADTSIPEICWNGLDEDGDGTADNGCGCDVFVVPNTIDVGVPVQLLNALGRSTPVFQSVTAAISSLPASSTRTVCIVSALSGACGVSAVHQESFTIPPNTTVVGGFTVSGLTATANTTESCRSLVRGQVTFASTSNERSMLARVRLEYSSSGAAVRMNASGWVIDSSVSITASAGGEAVAIGGNGAGLRVLSNLDVAADGTGDVSTIRFTGGTLFSRDLTLRAANGQTVYGVDLVNLRLAVLSRVSISGLYSTQRSVGVHVQNPAGYTLLSALGGGAAGGTHSAGVFVEGPNGAPQVVRIENSNWGGSNAIDETIGVHVRGLRAELVSSASPTSSIVARSMGPAVANNADALRCESEARCVVTGTAATRMSLLATTTTMPAATAVTASARGAAVYDGASASFSYVSVRGTNGARVSRGIEFDGRALRVSQSEIAGGVVPGGSSTSVELTAGAMVEISNSVLRGDYGIALSMDARSVRQSKIVSNTLTRTVVNREAPLFAIDAMSSPASVHFENNLLSCSALEAESMQYAIQASDNPSPFSVFAYNMIAACSTLLTVGASDVTGADAVQARFAPALRAGVLRAVPTAALGANGWRLTASSPALSSGSPNIGGTLDIEGTPRPTGAGPDIGADEQ